MSWTDDYEGYYHEDDDVPPNIPNTIKIYQWYAPLEDIFQREEDKILTTIILQ